jgi:Ser/Thr protein kinase RdoA (MazF antagonist)
VLPDHAEDIAAAYDLGSPVGLELAARGEQGKVWRLETDRGVFAVKELLLRQDEADADADVAFQQAAIAAGVTAPRPLRTSSGRVLTEVGPHQVRGYDWFELLPVDQGADPALVGATVAAVHRVQHGPARPLHPWYTEPVGAERWDQLLSDARAAQAPYADGFAAEIPELLALEAVMEAPRLLQNCHRDLWAENLLPTPAGGLCVLDWENCGLEDPAHELPMVLLDFAWGDPARMRALVDAYVDAGGPARLAGRGTFTMVIAQFGHFWESAVAEYTAPDATADARTHSIGRVEPLLRQPLRLTDLDDVLDALGGSPGLAATRI